MPMVFSAVITPNPARLGTNSIKLTLKGTNDVPVVDATLTVKVWMPAHGHGSAAPTVTNNGDGTYTLTGVSFTMYGTWTVTVTASAQVGAMTGTKVFSYAVN